EPTFPGCVISVKPIALFKMRDEKGEDDKIVCVPLRDPGWAHAETLDDIPKPMQREIKHLFTIYKELEAKAVEVEGWRSREAALGEVRGGHFHPAITVAMAAPRRIDPVDAVVYLLAQPSGGVLGALLVKALLLDEGRASHYGAATISPLLAGNVAGAVVEGL